VERFSVLKAIIMEEEVAMLDMAAVEVGMEDMAVEVDMEFMEVVMVMAIVSGGFDRELQYVGA
jgi:hypothetical protein